tara:strand:+ start:5116 stop:5289 length:174 start_codon:yes stop_codon:yes gene_type:complete
MSKKSHLSSFFANHSVGYFFAVLFIPNSLQLHLQITQIFLMLKNGRSKVAVMLGCAI